MTANNKPHIRLGFSVAALQIALLWLAWHGWLPLPMMTIPIAYGLGIVLCCLWFYKTRGGEASFADVFFVGFKTSLLTNALVVVAFVVVVKLLDRTMLPRWIEVLLSRFHSENSSVENYQQLKTVMRQILLPSLITVYLFVFSCLGVLSSLMAAQFRKKK